MRSLIIVCTLTSLLLAFPASAADDIALCGKLEGWTHYHASAFGSKSRAGWQKDSISSGKTALKRLSPGDHDILYIDTTGNIFSYKQDGAQIYTVRSSKTEIALIVLGKRGTIEFYHFYADSEGSLKMDWGQNKGHSVLMPKSTLMTANCSFIKFNIKN